MKSRLSDAELIKYNKLGLIVGPEEDEDEFIARARFCLSAGIKEELKGSLFQWRALLLIDPVEDECLQRARTLYDIEPVWVPIIFGNSRLSLWHGGCTWFFDGEKAPGAFIQLRSAFLNKPKRRHQLIAHELAHVARMAFGNSRYEEHFAYKSSHSAWRRYLGPIIENEYEVWYLWLALLAWGGLLFFGFSTALALAPLLFILIVGVMRLFSRHYLWSKAEQAVRQLIGEKAPYLLFRLTDEEIEMFAKLSSSAIKDFAEKNTSLRWRQLKTAYF